jgi:hypothetical protein
MTLTDTPPTLVGTAEKAAAVAEWHIALFFKGIADQPDGIDYLDQGSQRTIYLDQTAAVVYKVGNQSANREEVRVLDDLRAQGFDHAPPATLHEVRIWDSIFGEWTDRCVVAMPYLPEDGSVPHVGVVLDGAGDLNPGNVHANGGKLWLIDAGGL